MNINTIEAYQLSKHPYLNYNQANSIVEIRKQHGIYTKPKDLLQSKLLSEEDLVKLTPYLNFDEK
jgi:DNA uptake protein ComE-like DNA-binding protein